MPSKGVVLRQRISEDLVAAARTHAEEVGNRLNQDLLGTAAEGETVPDYIALLLQLGRHLEEKMQELVAADEAHLIELDDDQDPRLRREEAAADLHEKVVEIREALGGFFGTSEAGSLLGVEGPTSSDPRTLHRQAMRLLERLREPAPELPSLRLNGLQLDRAALAEELQPAVDELDRALVDIARERREAESTQEQKNEKMAEVDTALRGVGRCLQGYYELSGFSMFAERIRLTRRRRGRGPGELEPPVQTTSPDEPGTSEGSPTTEPPSSDPTASPPDAEAEPGPPQGRP